MTHVHVQAVDGQPPAIVFYNEAADTVVFIKALDLTGSTWQTAADALVIARGGGQYARWVPKFTTRAECAVPLGKAETAV